MGGRCGGVRAGAKTQTQCWIFHPLTRRRQAQTSPSFPAALVLFPLLESSQPPTLLCLHFVLPVPKSNPSLLFPPSLSLSHFIPLPPLCHFEKLQYGAGTLTDTDASPIRCTFLLDSVFGSAPPLCPNLSQLCKKRDQKKKDSI